MAGKAIFLEKPGVAAASPYGYYYRSGPADRGGRHRRRHEQHEQWEVHRHDAAVHTHRYYHVIHNHNRIAGGFDHLSSEPLSSW